MGSAFGAGSLTQQILNREHSFSTYAKFYEELPFLSPWCTLSDANFTYVLNEWSCIAFSKLIKT